MSTHDVKKYFHLLLNNNANLLEELLSPLAIITSPEHEELQYIMQGNITTRHRRHYMGMAASDLNIATKKRSVKFGLHLYRSLLCGLHFDADWRDDAALAHLADGSAYPVCGRIA